MRTAAQDLVDFLADLGYNYKWRDRITVLPHPRYGERVSPAREWSCAGVAWEPRHVGQLSTMDKAFYSDKDVARRLNLSPSWVRGQRHKRKHGLPHIFNIEPRYIGSCPRYVVEEVEAFIAVVAA